MGNIINKKKVVINVPEEFNEKILINNYINSFKKKNIFYEFEQYQYVEIIKNIKDKYYLLKNIESDNIELYKKLGLKFLELKDINNVENDIYYIFEFYLNKKKEHNIYFDNKYNNIYEYLIYKYGKDIYTDIIILYNYSFHNKLDIIENLIKLSFKFININDYKDYELFNLFKISLIFNINLNLDYHISYEYYMKKYFNFNSIRENITILSYIYTNIDSDKNIKILIEKLNNL
jgi:hypothetical protein